MEGSTVTSKGRVTIPQGVRRKLRIRQGSRVAFAIRNGKAEMRVLHRAPERIESGYGMLKVHGRHLPADFDPANLLADKRGRKR